MGQKCPNGYGFIEVGLRMQMAHRVSLALCGVKVDGLIVHHMCRNKLCVNPSHLQLLESHHEHGALHGFWTKEAIVKAIRAFAAEFGQPPSQNDWEPTAAIRRGQFARAERYLSRKGEWPSTPTVYAKFGSWASAIETAGFARPRRGHGQRRESADIHALSIAEG